MAWTELVAKRGPTSRTYKDSETGRVRMESRLGTPLHYASTPGGALDSTIDMTPIRVQNAEFDGWEVTQNGFHYRIGQRTGKGDGWIGFGGRRGAKWFWYHTARAGYLRWSTRAWQDIGGAPAYTRGNLSMTPDAVTVGPNNESVTVGATINWLNIWQFSGNPIDLRWHVDGEKVKGDVLVPQATRDYIRTNLPPSTPASQTWFGFVFQVDWSDIPRRYIDGVLTGADTDSATTGEIALRDAADNLLALMPIEYVFAGPNRQPSPLRRRMWKDADGNHYLLVGIRCDTLNNLPAGDLVFDPTLTLQPDATAGVDCFVRSDNPDENTGTNAILNGVPGQDRWLLRFDLSDLEGVSSLDSGTLSFWIATPLSWGSTITLNAYRVLSASGSWTETGAKWNYQTGTTRWAGDTDNNGGSNAGCSVSGTDYDGTSMGSATVTTSHGTGTKRGFTLDMTELAEMVAANYGFVIGLSGGGGDSFQADSSDSTTASERPELVVEYTEGGGTDALTANGITTTPSLGTPALGQTHALTATGITTTPTLETPAVGQTHALTATGLTATPTLGTPAVGQTHALTATGLTATPTLGTPTLGQAHALVATGVTTTPTLGTPVLGQVHALTATGLTLGAPTLGTPVLTEAAHALTATGLLVGAPVVDSPVLTQIHALIATALTTGPPTLGTPMLLSGSVDLTATGLTVTPTLGNPLLTHVVVPAERKYTVEEESRVFTVDAETRTFTVAAESRTLVA